ncbi:MAG: hypothetical protein DRI34_01130 [Deltaproteobacteria bacterium]|nr:MAG: hypothetical protein DRI34_01130 [Deltaproteobacteria bacterium]
MGPHFRRRSGSGRLGRGLGRLDGGLLGRRRCSRFSGSGRFRRSSSRSGRPACTLAAYELGHGLGRETTGGPAGSSRGPVIPLGPSASLLGSGIRHGCAGGLRCWRRGGRLPGGSFERPGLRRQRGGLALHRLLRCLLLGCRPRRRLPGRRPGNDFRWRRWLRCWRLLSRCRRRFGYGLGLHRLLRCLLLGCRPRRRLPGRRPGNDFRWRRWLRCCRLLSRCRRRFGYGLGRRSRTCRGLLRGRLLFDHHRRLRLWFGYQRAFVVSRFLGRAFSGSFSSLAAGRRFRGWRRYVGAASGVSP